MAFDGVTVSAIASEINEKLVGGRIYKIYQPEADELCLVVKNKRESGAITARLVISADASLPLLYLTEQAKENPVTAPNFCMLLRKHIGNARILSVKQPNFERIVEIELEHLDEMGDLCRKKLIIEIMGKHSNLIFTDENDRIIDSIKHVSNQVSSVREVLPGRIYVYPPAHEKENPLTIDINFFMNHVLRKPLSVSKAIYTTLTGLSPVIANEICERAGVDGGQSTAALTMQMQEALFKAFECVMTDIRNAAFRPCIAYQGYEPKEFAAVELTMFGEVQENLPQKDANGLKVFSSMSAVIEEYYQAKSIVIRIRQRSTDLRKIVANAIDRTAKKYDLQLSQLKDTEKRDKYKIYGELLTAYGYSCNPGDKQITCENYYDGKEITIPLDPEQSAMENAKRYFQKYNKLKRTYEALMELTKESKAELDYLLSVQNALEIAKTENDLMQIKQELVESGYVRGKNDRGKMKKQGKAKPLHYISSDGYHMYVGKNNLQNEELTFKFAEGNDLWFHAKQMPGSHVIVKTNGETEIPDRTYEEAARLAAYYSTGKDAPKVEIDYTKKKNLKKPPKAKPGFVIYHTNYSMSMEPDIHGISEVG